MAILYPNVDRHGVETGSRRAERALTCAKGADQRDAKFDLAAANELLRYCRV